MPDISNTFASKLPEAGTTIFTVMSKMALDYNAMNLSQGFPDFNCSDKLLDLVNDFQRKGFNQYAPMQGVPALREAVSSKIEKLYEHHYDHEKEITITAGATQAIFTAVTAAVNKGDEVILLEPAYDSYAPSVLVNGGKPVFVPLNPEDFSIDWEKVNAVKSEKTRMIIINSPHNPTGSVINENDIKALEEFTRDTNILILSDEVYEHIIFDGGKHLSISTSEELASRAFVISSFGKTYHTTGWKIGYCAAPAGLSSEFRKIHQFNVFAVNTPIQYAYSEFMKSEDEYLSLQEFYEKKRNIVLEILKDSRFKFTPTKGTFFQLLDYSGISGLNDMDFTADLTKEKGIATIPLSPFYSGINNNKIIRICFAKKDDALVKAANILKEI